MTREVNEIDRHIGKRIRARRLELHLSQTQIADALGVSFQQVQKYERGANRVAAGNLARIAEAMEVPISYFYDGAPGVSGRKKAGPSVMEEFGATREGVAIAEAFTRIRGTHKRQALARVITEIVETFNPVRRLQAAE